jgi:hypothetical protein
MNPTRRRLLAFGVAGTAALTCGGGLGWLTLGYDLDAGDVPIALSTKELAVVRAIVDALLPADGDLPSGLSLGVHQRIDEEVWAADDALRADLAASLHLLEHGPVLLGFPGRLTGLSAEQRLDVLERALRSGPTPVVQAVLGLKQMCHLFYFTHPATWDAIGYDGPWISPAKPPPSAVAYQRLLAAAREVR